MHAAAVLPPTQDVELQSNCLLTCFGLHAVNIQTAGQGGSLAPEVSAVFVKEPKKVCQSIQLAVKLSKQSPVQGGGYMARGPLPAWGEVSAAGAKVSISMVQRLQGLEALVTRGVLTRAEADGLKVGGENFPLLKVAAEVEAHARCTVKDQKAQLTTQLGW